MRHLAIAAALISAAACSGGQAPPAAPTNEGQQIFRFDTFGDEDFWGGRLRLNEAIEGSAHGGVGAGVSPKTALAVGLKVDVDALDSATVDALKNGKVNLDDPAVTVTLLTSKAVLGVTGVSNGSGGLSTLGIQCALCHSTVDDSLAPGIGHRLDGWPNRDLNVGAIVNLSPDLTAVATLLGVDQSTVRTVLASWGPGKFDAELFLDGKAFQPGGASAATLIPAAFGLEGVNLHTYTGWGSIPYWNAFVANLEMHGKGNFFDPRLDDATRFPVAARNHFGHVTNATDLITSKLAALQEYQLSLDAPTPPAGSFDAAAAGRGEAVFETSCARCHVAPAYTEPGWDLHTGAEIGIDDFQASRSPDGMYRTTPLRGLFARAKGGFYHDGRFATLPAVVDHYDSALTLGLSASQKTDLVEFLKSL
jgi:cytochrome c5